MAELSNNDFNYKYYSVILVLYSWSLVGTFDVLWLSLLLFLVARPPH